VLAIDTRQIRFAVGRKSHRLQLGMMRARVSMYLNCKPGKHLCVTGKTQESTASAGGATNSSVKLERDESGELRDRLFGDLHGRGPGYRDLRSARKPDAGQAKILQPLLEAVKLSQDLVLEVWDSLHGSAVARHRTMLQYRRSEYPSTIAGDYPWQVHSPPNKSAPARSAETDGFAERDVSILPGDRKHQGEGTGRPTMMPSWL